MRRPKERERPTRVHRLGLVAKILIVEDEALIALDLQLIIESFDPSHQVWIESSVATAAARLREDSVNFAFLDINVADGTTIALARQLKSCGVSFVFMSGGHGGLIPADLASVTLLPKPCSQHLLLKALNEGLGGTSARATL